MEILYKDKENRALGIISILNDFQSAYSKIPFECLWYDFKTNIQLEVSPKRYYYYGLRIANDSGNHKLNELYYYGIKIVLNKEIPDNEIWYNTLTK